MTHTDPPPSGEPTPVRSRWDILDRICRRTSARALRWAGVHVRVGSSSVTLGRAGELVAIARELTEIVELIEREWIVHAPAAVEFEATLARANELRGMADKALAKVGVR